jgi:heme-degrading monooxygenase HmoA
MQDRINSAKLYVVLWEFQVRPEFEELFQRIYGSQGDWAELFRKGKGYVRTEFYRDVKNARRYVTVDVWESELAYHEFRKDHEKEYRAIDQRGEGMTEKETSLGAFEMLPANSET